MRVTWLVLCLVCQLWKPACADTLELHIDADYAISSLAAQSIERGITTALAEVGNQIAGHNIVVVPNDHRGSVIRARQTFENVLNNDRALAIFGGLHSPPYLTHQDFLNHNKIPTLLPWSAAGAITRPAHGIENWIFRLSVDDVKTAPFLVDTALASGGCADVGLILVDTGWGRGNYTPLSNALATHGKTAAFAQFFNATLKQSGARILAEDFARSGADCAILLANWDNGSEVVKALHARQPDTRVFSHWGITGGAFTEVVPHHIRSDLDMRVLQTCGLSKEANGSDILSAALLGTGQGYTNLSDVPASTGFVHAYDLTRVLIAAVNQAATTSAWSGDITAKRAALRDALENLAQDVTGILKTYAPPFHPYSDVTPDAHEALGLNDLCMTRFDKHGDLVLIP